MEAQFSIPWAVLASLPRGIVLPAMGLLRVQKLREARAAAREAWILWGSFGSKAGFSSFPFLCIMDVFPNSCWGHARLATHGPAAEGRQNGKLPLSHSLLSLLQDSRRRLMLTLQREARRLWFVQVLATCDSNPGASIGSSRGWRSHVQVDGILLQSQTALCVADFPSLSPFISSLPLLPFPLLPRLSGLSPFMSSLLGCSAAQSPKRVPFHAFASGLFLPAAAALSSKVVSLHAFPFRLLLVAADALSLKLVSLHRFASGLLLAAAAALSTFGLEIAGSYRVPTSPRLGCDFRNCWAVMSL